MVDEATQALVEKFRALDKAMGGVKALIAVDTDAAASKLVEEFEKLQAKANEAADKARAKKNEVEKLLAAHPMTPKLKDLRAQRDAVEAQIRKAGLVNW